MISKLSNCVFQILGTAVFLISLVASMPAHTAEVVGHSDLDGAPVELLADGTWRFSDSVGPVCHEVTSLVSVCPIPSDWHPYPEIGHEFDWPTFKHDTNLVAAVEDWTEGAGTTINGTSMLLAIKGRSKVGKLEGHIIEQYPDVIAGYEGTTIVIQSFDGKVRAFTFTYQPELAVLATSTRFNTTLFHQDHRALHKSLIASITLTEPKK